MGSVKRIVQVPAGEPPESGERYANIHLSSETSIMRLYILLYLRVESVPLFAFARFDYEDEYPRIYLSHHRSRDARANFKRNQSFVTSVLRILHSLQHDI